MDGPSVLPNTGFQLCWTDTKVDFSSVQFSSVSVQRNVILTLSGKTLDERNQELAPQSEEQEPKTMDDPYAQKPAGRKQK